MHKQSKFIKWLIWIAIVLATLRLISLPFTPLTDTTEARYAEIGRIMAESGNLITPMLDGAPFWAKPPLSFWATALSYKIFGVNDFAAHFPHFLFLIGSALLLYYFVRRHRGEFTAAVAAAALMTMPVFLYLAGGVMTDPAMAFCATLTMVAFYNAVTMNHRGWGYLFFVGLALGLLAKGPLILVIVGMAIFIWTLFKNKWRDIWFNVPWVTGAVLMLCIAVPWYILAEDATPGFLKYFIIGEHFERYLTPGWKGDLYGAGRGGFVGKIWLIYLITIVPWSIWFAVKLFLKKFRNAIVNTGFIRDGFLLYAAAFAFAPLLFFTFSKNIVPAYVLPTMIPTAILIAAALGNNINLKMFKWLAGIIAAMLMLVILAQVAYPRWSADAGLSDKYFISKAESPLIFYKVKNYSAEFYAAARKINYDFAESPEQLKEFTGFVLMRKKDFLNIEHSGLPITSVLSGERMVLIKIGQ